MMDKLGNLIYSIVYVLMVILVTVLAISTYHYREECHALNRELKSIDKECVIIERHVIEKNRGYKPRNI